MLRVLALILFWPGVAVIAWGELTPHPPQEAQLIWDKAEHFTAYFGLAAMATLVLRRGRRLVLALAGILLLAGLLELLQAYTGRDPEWSDMLANSLGWLAGWAAGLALLALPGLVGGPRPD
jgi:VanZ family protein